MSNLELNYYSDTWNKIEQKHFLGNIVRIRIAEDVIPEEEIICDEGIIRTALYCHYFHSDIKVHRIEYDVILPRNYWGNVGRIVRVGQRQIIENKTLGWKK